MKKYLSIYLLIISIFFVTNIVGQNKSYNRTDDNCEDSAPHLKTEFNAWKKEAVQLNASSASNDLQTLDLLHNL